MASPAVIYDNALPNGANGAPRASHNAAVAIPDTVPSVETLEAYQAQASGRELTPEQELLVLHQQKRAEELAAAQGKSAVVGLAGMGASIAATEGVKRIGESAAKYVGPVGHAASAGIAVISGDMKAKQRLAELTSLHLEEIKNEFGVENGEATDAHLRRLAEMPGYEQLNTEMKVIDQEIGRALTGTAAGAGGWVAGTAVATMIAGAAMSATGIGSVVGVPTFIAGAMVAVPTFIAGMVGSVVASSVADKAVNAISGVDPSESAYNQLTKMQEKLAQRLPVDQIDVFKALVAGDKNLTEEIKGQSGGKKFDELKPEEQLDLLKTHHANLLDASQQLAYQINCGDTLPTRLISLNTRALAMEGAEAAYNMTRSDLMLGAGQNIVNLQGANNIVPFGTPSTTISSEGSNISPMVARPKGIGVHEAAALAAQQNAQQGVGAGRA
jgi:hypothetical protein